MSITPIPSRIGIGISISSDDLSKNTLDVRRVKNNRVEFCIYKNFRPIKTKIKDDDVKILISFLNHWMETDQ